MSERQLHNVVSIQQLQYHSTMCTSFLYRSVLMYTYDEEISQLISYDVAPGKYDVKDVG